MIRNLKIRNNRLTVFGNFHIFRIILTDRYTWINDIRNYHHIFEKFFLYLFLSCGKFFNTGSGSSYLFFYFFCFFFFALALGRAGFAAGFSGGLRMLRFCGMGSFTTFSGSSFTY